MKSLENMGKNELYLEVLKYKSLLDNAGKELIKKDNDNKDLKVEVATLNGLLQKKDEAIFEIRKELDKVKEMLMLNNMKLYGKALAKLDDSDQFQTSLGSFGIDVNEPQVEITDEEKGVATVKGYTRRTYSNKEKHIDYTHLDQHIVYHKPEGEVLCDICGKPMSIYKYYEYKELVYVPAQLFVNIHRTPCYKCEECVNENYNASCFTAKTYLPLIKHSLVSSTLVAALIDYKYNRGLPFYAIEKIFIENGINIPRENMCNWMKYIMRYINPLWDIMHEDLLSKSVLAADETPMYVLKEEGKAPNSTSYLWQYQTSIHEDERIVLFDYKPNRKKENAINFLDGFKGYLITDKYGGYNDIDGVINSYCHVHALRGFKESESLLPKGSVEDSLEHQAVVKYLAVFDKENSIRDKARKNFESDISKQYEYINEHRIEVLKLFEKFLAWLLEIKPQVVCKAKFTNSIDYILKDADKFKTFVKDARIPLSNNSCEQNFRSWVVNRKRCKFYCSTSGGDAAAKIYSLLCCAKENGYMPYSYFTYLFDNIRYENMNDKNALKKYLPYKKLIPDYCKQMSEEEINNKIERIEKETKDS